MPPLTLETMIACVIYSCPSQLIQNLPQEGDFNTFYSVYDSHYYSEQILHCVGFMLQDANIWVLSRLHLGGGGAYNANNFT